MKHQDKNNYTAKAATPAADILVAHKHCISRLYSRLRPCPEDRSVRVVPEIKNMGRLESQKARTIAMWSTKIARFAVSIFQRARDGNVREGLKR